MANRNLRLKWRADLSDPSDIFIPISFTETQVLVQPKANVITIQTVGKLFEVKEMLLQRARYCRLETYVF